MPKQPFYKSLIPLNLQFFADDPSGGSDPSGGGDTSEGDDPSDQDSKDGPNDKKYDEAYVKQLRAEAAKYRTKLKDLEGQTKTQQQEMMKKVFEAFGLEADPNKEFEKQLSDAQKKAQEAEQKANNRLIRAEVKMVAAELGIIDDEAAFALMAKDDVKVNDDGDVEGVKEALEALVEAKPYLKGQAGTPQGGGDFSGGNKPADLDAKIAEAESKGNWREVIRLQREKAFKKQS